MELLLFFRGTSDHQDFAMMDMDDPSDAANTCSWNMNALTIKLA
jgi:hypothetical protein